MLDERLGKWAFWLWVVGFWVAWAPGYVAGLEGMTRRLQHYDNPAWHPWMLLSALGVLIILAGIVAQIAQLVVSIRTRAARRDLTGDPWDGRSLEWATSSPPPVFNYATLPNVTARESYWDAKQQPRETTQPITSEPDYEPIEIPRNTPVGFVTAFLATVTGFALIWHIWWMVVLGLLGALITFVVFAWRDRTEFVISADEAARVDRANRAVRAESLLALAR